MKALSIGTNQVEYVEIETPIEEGHIKVKVTLAAITHADVALSMGADKDKLPRIGGRIAVGLVSEAPESTGLMKGERVLLSPYRDGKVRGLDIDGYLSEYAVVPMDCVYPLPEGVTDRDAIFAELIAVAVRTIDKLNVQDGEYVTLLGTDYLSLILAQLVDYYHAIPIIVANEDEGLQLAQDMGLTYCIDKRTTDVLSRIRNITGGVMTDCTVFEGLHPVDPQLAIDATKMLGRICIVGTDGYIGPIQADLSNIMRKRIVLTGATNGGRNILTAINLLATEALHVDFFQPKTIDFEQAKDTLEILSTTPNFNGLVLCRID
ncbi:MAG: zinc-binding dehydrogenase [Clostridia bacterium]|nr:zinc-binding dehydrogenase [Clostridia bacterium]